ncbi:hypothetical protein D3C87_1199740 [compost metagenome]
MVDDFQADFRGFFPFPLAAQLIFWQRFGQCFGLVAFGAVDLDGCVLPIGGQERLAAFDDVQLAALAARLASLLQCIEKQRHQFRCAVAVDQADVQGVADFAVEGVAHHAGEARGIGVGISDQPGTTGAMQADRGAGLLRDAAQLADGATRTTGHGQRQPPVGEHRPTGRMVDALDQRHSAIRQPGSGKRRVQCMFDNGLGGAQRIAANAQHGRITGAQHASGIGEDIRPAFKDKRDDPQWRHHLLDLPAVVLDATDHLATRGGRVAPGAQAGDHVTSHALIGQQPRGRTATGLGPLDVGLVGRFDQGPAFHSFQALGEQIEEMADRLIRHRRHCAERSFRTFDRDRRRLLVGHRNQQQFAADLFHQQVVSGLEACRQFGADHSDTITGERDRRASD